MNPQRHAIQYKSSRASEVLRGGALTTKAPQPYVAVPRATVEAIEGAALPMAAYLRRLAAIATDLVTRATSGCNARALRQLHQRLVQWIEDVRSVGGDQRLIAAVEARIRRLSTILAAPQKCTTDVRAIATELEQVAGGPTPRPASAATPGEAPPAPRRTAFWK